MHYSAIHFLHIPIICKNAAKIKKNFTAFPNPTNNSSWTITVENLPMLLTLIFFFCVPPKRLVFIIPFVCPLVPFYNFFNFL